MTRTITFCFGLFSFSAVAMAAGYAEFYVKVSKPESIGPQVKALRATAFAAARAGEAAKLQASFAKEVAIFTASANPKNSEDDTFKLVGKVSQQLVIARVAQLNGTSDQAPERQVMRSGLFALASLLLDPHIGDNGKMDGAICNRPVNKPEEVKFKAARLLTQSQIADWVVVKQDMGPTDIADAPGQYPTKFYKDQMVLETKETHGDNRWTSIAAMDGGDSLFYQHPESFSVAPFFAKYVAEHVCFGKIDGDWKITALALRD